MVDGGGARGDAVRETMSDQVVKLPQLEATERRDGVDERGRHHTRSQVS